MTDDILGEAMQGEPAMSLHLIEKPGSDTDKVAVAQLNVTGIEEVLAVLAGIHQIAGALTEQMIANDDTESMAEIAGLLSGGFCDVIALVIGSGSNTPSDYADMADRISESVGRGLMRRMPKFGRQN